MGTALPLAALAHAGVEELLARGGEVVGAGARPARGRTTTSTAPSGSRSSSVSMPSTRAGASDSMPSTAMPSAIFSSRSASAGKLSASSRGPLAHGVGEQQLAARRRPQPVLGDLERALVGDLEPADLLDVVAQELHAQRVLLGGREDVEDAAAHGELAAPLDQVDAGVGGRRRAPRRPARVGLVAGLRARPAPGRPGPWTMRLQHRAHRRDDDRQRRRASRRRLGVRQPAQHREPLPDGVAARAQPLVRQGLPRRGTSTTAPAPQARLERGVEVLGLATGGGDGEDRGAGGGGRQGGDEDGAGAGGCRGDDLRRRHGEGLDEAGGAREGRRPGSAGQTKTAFATA